MTPRLQDLFEKWQALRDQGTPVSSEDLCRDCPELISEFRRLLDRQAEVGAIATAAESSASGTVVAEETPNLHGELLVEDAAARVAKEQVETLRARLRLAVCVILARWLIYGSSILAEPATEVPTLLMVLAALLACYGYAAIILGRRSSWSLRSLRFLEMLIFGSLVVVFLVGDRAFYVGDFQALLRMHEGLMLYVAADAIGSPWFELIIIYGLFIPNTWQRCTMVVACMALTPLVLLACYAYHFDVLGHSMVGAVLRTQGMRLGFGAAIAILGCYRIDKLQREARAARELGQYSLKQRLGQGGMAEVYLAEHRLLRRLCAIKLIRGENADDPHAQRRFAREVRAMSRIRHPHIVEIFDYGVSAEGKFYYVMEYLEGVNLEDLVQRHGPLPPERAVFLLRQLAAALEAMHAHGVIHRDVKPSNVFVSPPDALKLFDFGLVHVDGNRQTLTSVDEARLTRDNCIVGTPAYMAPEQIDLSRPVDVRSDLYALGLVGYFLLSGSNPFLRGDTREIFAAQLHEEPPPLRDLGARRARGPQRHRAPLPGEGPECSFRTGDELAGSSGRLCVRPDVDAGAGGRVVARSRKRRSKVIRNPRPSHCRRSRSRRCPAAGCATGEDDKSCHRRRP